MYEQFYKLDREKQKRIVNASLKVFSADDFKHASTDDIAAKAQIAKGSLFQYFKNKKTLYMFMYNYALQMLGDKAQAEISYDENDYFEIRKKNLEIKSMLYKQYPFLYHFILKAQKEKDLELAEWITKVNKTFQTRVDQQVFANVDYERFMEDIDIENLNKMISWCSEGIWNEGEADGIAVEEMVAQAHEMFDFFKKATYKPDYLVVERGK
ncbi:TetR/AcrR family transcriptional regulator [Tindallia californiensis]|uniref:DNA-binding transcriptional regulator, AcrR family n=1 Tax=Tindallia californiensis TaxID=159292 RepID=A0A1H3PQW6_9FIRM|nr:TetR/AcrR family transcriptional regulator [Tindallia californiensis]SDZ03477.1 DNA-binding transcriptional regulator, AcrR family [Tindallia californiensis]